MLLASSLPMTAGQNTQFMLAGLKLLPTPWDKEANFAKFEGYARKAAAAGADMIVTPEGYLDGYSGNRKVTPDSTPEKYHAVGEELDGPYMQRIAQLARELRVFLVIGFAERNEGKMYNSLVMFSREGERVGRYSKTHNVAKEEPDNTNGTEFPVFDTELGRLGMLVCYDRQLPETSRILAIKGAGLILVPAFGLGIQKMSEDIMMRTRAYENGVYVAHVHPKNTFIVDPKGNILAQQEGDKEGIVMAEIHLDERIGSGSIGRRRPEIYGEILGPLKRP
jgi:predicted amidohydrolase